MTPLPLPDLRLPALPGADLPFTAHDVNLAYRALPRVSNSDLTRFKDDYLTYPRSPQRQPAESVRRGSTPAVGKAFHQHLLEPETVGTVLEQLLPDFASNRLTNTGRDGLDELMAAVRHDPFCRRYLRLAEQHPPRFVAGQERETASRERVVLFTDPITKLACKTRLDLLYTSPKRQNALILDFKTTSARTQSQFLQSCYDYDYDRQAAFYLDSLHYADGHEWASTQRTRFVFVGVMKQTPHRLFAIDATSLPGFVDYGRKKYRFWLKKWQEISRLPD